MPRLVEFPRAKALVQKAVPDIPDLNGAAAHRWLKTLSEKEHQQVEAGQRPPSRGFPLLIPIHPKTCARWIQEVPKSKPWDGETASPVEFQAIARVLRELTRQKALKRMFTQAEAERIARFSLIAPDTPALTLWSLARLAIVMEANNVPLDALNSYLVFAVPDMPEAGNYPAANWVDMYYERAGKAFPDLPDHYIDVFEMNEILAPTAKGGK